MLTLDPQTDRDWWPVDWIDDEVPQGFTTPDSSLGRLADGAHAFGNFKEVAGEVFGPKLIAEGEIVRWGFRDYLGTVSLTLHADGTHRYDPQPPAATTTLWHYDSEVLADNPDEMAQFMRDFMNEVFDIGTEFEVSIAHWGDEVALRFTAIDGPPRFVIVEAPTAPSTAEA